MKIADIVALAQNAGLPLDKAQIAAAIAMAESSGNPNSHNYNPVTKDDSYGLWQINLWGDLKGRVGQLGLKTAADLFNPQVNAAAMARYSKNGTDFTPWSTYTRNDYKKFLSSAQKAKPAVAAPDGIGGDLAGGAVGALGGGLIGDAQALGGAVGDTAALAKEAGQALQRTANWVTTPQNWLRVGLVIVGGTAVLAGISQVIASTKAGQQAISGTKTVVKAAAAA